VQQDERSRCSKTNTDEATGFTGKLTGEAMSGLIPGSEGDFDVLFKVDDEGRLCSAELTGAFYGEKNGELTYTLTLDEYGTKKDITAP